MLVEMCTLKLFQARFPLNASCFGLDDTATSLGLIADLSPITQLMCVWVHAT